MVGKGYTNVLELEDLDVLDLLEGLVCAYSWIYYDVGYCMEEEIT